MGKQRAIVLRLARRKTSDEHEVGSFILLSLVVWLLSAQIWTYRYGADKSTKIGMVIP